MQCLALGGVRELPSATGVPNVLPAPMYMPDDTTKVFVWVEYVQEPLFGNGLLSVEAEALYNLFYVHCILCGGTGCICRVSWDDSFIVKGRGLARRREGRGGFTMQIRCSTVLVSSAPIIMGWHRK